MILPLLSKYADHGLLVLRIVFGVMFLYYGAPKLFGGTAAWGELGAAMSNIGISFAPAFWGFMAAFSMFFGGICIILGLFFRIACIFLAFTMFVAFTMHLRQGQGLMAASHAIEDCAVFLALIFVGPGKYSLDSWIRFF